MASSSPDNATAGTALVAEGTVRCSENDDPSAEAASPSVL